MAGAMDIAGADDRGLQEWRKRLLARSDTVGDAAGLDGKILDGLLKNRSEIQPDTLHADTQGQSEPVFGLCRLLGRARAITRSARSPTCSGDSPLGAPSRKIIHPGVSS
jgi:hypothetical protein